MNDERKKNRILALVFGGILFVIILPVNLSIAAFFLDILLFIPGIFIFPINLITGIPILIIGFFWAIWANVDLFDKGKGSPVPTKSTETIFLVNSGPYKYSRNPMIFGTYFIFVGIGMLFDLITLILIIATLMLVGLIIYVKITEEKRLEERFGESYRDYKRKTSFIIPWISKKQT
ncbi:MAG: isoprenylcysteine carboxylmethyltransferase family protein [Candidatus Lokiarchaeota archaeon]|nr:isoprenylcysteine carboxylmethyltransferase family protein [Candidatus Lokiarchaeota archaeon]